jgi:signal transduction histidine kinase
LTRAEAGKLRTTVECIDIPQLLSGVEGSVRWMLETKPLTLAVESEPGIGLLYSDRGKLSQALVNLVINAIKFTPEGGRVKLCARRMGERIAFEVEDTGIGIPEEQQEMIFEAFHQVDSGDERSHGGVGLGLAIVQHMLSLLDGELQLESRVGEGSTFRVLLPLGEPPE